jgi:hypothetical protein
MLLFSNAYFNQVAMLYGFISTKKRNESSDNEITGATVLLFTLAFFISLFVVSLFVYMLFDDPNLVKQIFLFWL